MSKIVTQRLKASHINETTRRIMFELFSQYYDDVTYNTFSNDLREKSHVFFLYNKQKIKEEIVGFSTILRIRSRNAVLLFSGDTVIHKDFWGSKELQLAFFRYIVESKIKALNKPVYWFLISKGHRTYLMMRKNFKKSFPCFEQHTPAHIKGVMDSFYEKKFKGFYKKEKGIIIFPKSPASVKPDYCMPENELLSDPDTKYFLKKNPDFHKGVELACIAEICWTDFIFHLKKFLTVWLKNFLKTSANKR